MGRKSRVERYMYGSIIEAIPDEGMDEMKAGTDHGLVAMILIRNGTVPSRQSSKLRTLARKLQVPHFHSGVLVVCDCTRTSRVKLNSRTATRGRDMINTIDAKRRRQ
jgi:hypothetical protein